MPLFTDSTSKNNTRQDIIWIQTSFIGDIILSTAAMAALHACRPMTKQHLITTAVGAEALRDHPLLTSVHVYSKRSKMAFGSKFLGLGPMLEIRTKIRKLNLTNPIILQPHKSLRSTLLAKVIGYPVITYAETTGSFFAFKRFMRTAVLHEAERVGLLLEGLGIDRREFLGHRPSLPAAALPVVAEALTKPLHWIAVAPGSVWATKRWPAEKYAALVLALLEKNDVGVVLLGSKDESEASAVILAAINHPEQKKRILNLVGLTTLPELNGIYPRVKALISNDSSAIHYASAFNIPTLAIFGSTVPAMGFAPLAEGSKIAELPLSCRPCSAHGPMVCPLGHFKCMNDLTVESVLAQVP
jgi:heptosyltransferase II